MRKKVAGEDVGELTLDDDDDDDVPAAKAGKVALNGKKPPA
jgi:hypothetical protein